MDGIEKLCECGCGRPTSIALVTNKTRGHVKGQPLRFLQGHSPRQGEARESFARAKEAAKTKLCECGCGLPVKSVATHGSIEAGIKRGDARRFIRGHHARVLNKNDRETRTCRVCGVTKPATREHFYAKYKVENPDFPWLGLHGICKECEAFRWEMKTPDQQRRALDAKRRYHEVRKDVRLSKDRARRATLKQEMVAAYGGRCSCCGESEIRFLTLEHIDGGGRNHRRRLNLTGAGEHLWRDLKRRGWPKDGYTILCWNCNCSQMRGEPCPHKLSQLNDSWGVAASTG